MVANFEYFATNFIEFSILLEEYEIIKYGGKYTTRRKLALSFREFVYFVRALLWTVNHINYMFMHNKAEK